ncbi:hypothetical protein ACX1N5_15310 [Acinetobacter sp. ANC 4636]
MKTFQVYIRRPQTQEPIWDYSKTVVASDERAAILDAYNSWVDENPTPPPPALNLCYAKVQQPAQLNSNLMQPVVLLNEMVSSYRNSHLHNFHPMALAVSEDTSDDLFSMVQASKEAPGSTSLAVVDTQGPGTSGGKPTQDALGIYNDMLTLSSLANVVAMKKVYDAHPAAYDITKPAEATAFIQAQAVNLNDTFTRQLGAYALPGETTSQHYSKEVLTADLHLEFLTTLFSSFAFPEAALTKLDAILTEVKDSLANLKVGLDSKDQTLDHIIFVNYLEPITLQGVPEKVITGKIRMFYLQINQSSWQATIGKSTVSKVKFEMNFYDTIFSINSNLVRSDISSITGLIKKFTGQSFEEMSKLTSPTVIKK